ncbi:MAG: hypothetical protein V4572_12100 [Bacteroidota bacterium]
MKDLIIIDGKFSNYILPKIKINKSTNWLLNGDKNSFFKYIQERYLGSVVNSAIINSFAKYIYGDGLIDENGINIKKYISKTDIRKIGLDFKMYGQFSLEIQWSQGSTLLKVEPTPIKIRWIDTTKFGLNLNEQGDVDGYWFSKDWANIGNNKPVFYKKFDGTFDQNYPTEILTINRVSTSEYFSQPDYTSGLQWAFVDEELANVSANYITNGLSAGKIINCVGGKIPTEDERQNIRENIVSKLTGSSNTNKVIVNFSDGTDGNNITVENIEISSLDATMVYYSTECANKLFISHNVVNPSLFGIIAASGFANTSEDRITSIKHLMQSNINPMREEIIDGLESVLRFVEPDISLKYKDFELDEETKITPPTNE